MNNTDKTIMVFVDTSYLSRRSGEQEADWNRLLRLSEEQKIDIYISQIAIEEYRTQTTDALIANIGKAQNALNNVKKAWSANLNLSKELGKFIQPEFPNFEKIEEASQKIIGDFITKNNIKILSPAPSHADRVWAKYFKWVLPFYSRIEERDSDPVRKSRRKDIPDAWICEAAIDLCSDNTRVLCLCKDDNLGNALRNENIETFDDAKDVLNIIEAPLIVDSATQELKVERQDVGRTPNIAVTASYLDQHLLSLAEREKELQIRILGYTQWYSPISKSDLTELLQGKGHTPQAIENAAQRLALNGLLKDTGNHYLSSDKTIAEQAKMAVESEILDTLDGQ